MVHMIRWYEQLPPRRVEQAVAVPAQPRRTTAEILSKRYATSVQIPADLTRQWRWLDVQSLSAACKRAKEKLLLKEDEC
jgi:hypothetical protein